jgi:sigma-B regulation protein RsbU (phosphoserine phosphatase)
LILRSNGTVEQIEIVGTPLGILPDSTYTTKTTVMETADTVLMATDGITEARHGYDFLGLDGMAALVAQAGSSSTLLELIQAIYGGAREFANGRLRDDVCLLVARRL